MRKWMERVFARYGTEALLETAQGAQSVHILFRAVRSDARSYAQQEFLPLGNIPRGRYICLLPIHAEATPGATLTVRGRAYLLRQVEEMAVFTEPVGQWCLCVEKGRSER